MISYFSDKVINKNNEIIFINDCDYDVKVIILATINNENELIIKEKMLNDEIGDVAFSKNDDGVEYLKYNNIYDEKYEHDEFVKGIMRVNDIYVYGEYNKYFCKFIKNDMIFCNSYNEFVTVYYITDHDSYDEHRIHYEIDTDKYYKECKIYGLEKYDIRYFMEFNNGICFTNLKKVNC